MEGELVSEPIESTVANDFGAHHGTPITNKATILSEIDKCLGRDKPPSVEYIFVAPFSRWTSKWFPWASFAGNYYGHSAVKYRHPDTQENVVMNISGEISGNLGVNFLTAENYLFGVEQFDKASLQGGIYNRNMISVRIEDYPEDKIRDMDYYFHKIARRSQDNQARFSMAFPTVWNFLRARLPIIDIAEHGNCARWTSKGLVEADVMQFSSIMPKSIWVQTFERNGIKDPNNVNVVSYRRVKHACQEYGEPEDPYISGVGPFRTLENLLYFDLESFANVIVEVPPGSMTAVVKPTMTHRQPSFLRYHRYVIAGSALGIFGIGRAVIRKASAFLLRWK